jgi:hypothetical protein
MPVVTDAPAPAALLDDSTISLPPAIPLTSAAHIDMSAMSAAASNDAGKGPYAGKVAEVLADALAAGDSGIPGIDDLVGNRAIPEGGATSLTNSTEGDTNVRFEQAAPQSDQGPVAGLPMDPPAETGWDMAHFGAFDMMAMIQHAVAAAGGAAQA